MEITREHVDFEIISRIAVKNSDDSDFHWHENIEIIQPKNKPCQFLVDGKLIDADIGDIVVVKDQSVHSYRIEDNTFVRITQFRPKILLKLDVPIKPIKKHITKEEIDAIPNLRQYIDNVFDLMDMEGKTLYASEKPFLQYLTVSMYMLLMQYFAEGENYSSSKKDRQEFYRITEYINQHFKEEINATIIGQKLFISRSHASKLFMKYSGMGLNDYIRSIRIKHANQLMIDGMSITEAALDSGFQCVRTFNNAYKAQLGITPTDFIKQTINQKRSKA